MDLAQLKTLDALTRNNQYSDDLFTAILPLVSGYFQSAQRLRALPLGEVKPVTTLFGGVRR
jgi:hypothetical protein